LNALAAYTSRAMTGHEHKRLVDYADCAG